MILDKTCNDSERQSLRMLVQLLEANKENLSRFLAEEGRLDKITVLLDGIIKKLDQKNLAMSREAQTMETLLEKTRHALQEEQRHSLQAKSFMQPLELIHLLEHALELSTLIVDKTHIRIKTRFNQTEMVILEKHKFIRVFYCLLGNACEALAEEGGDIEVAVVREKGRVYVKLSDTGPGIPPQNLPLVFRSGFTTKEGHRGFGLHYCANALDEMGATLELQNTERGLTVRLGLTPAQ